MVISVLIPVYNAEKNLRKCLNSVLNQDFKDFEIIAVDNNSEDRSREIIKSFRDKRIRYIFEKNRGRGYARNAGIKAARGDIIAMIDSDCVAPRNWLRKITEPIIKGKEEIVMGFEEDLTKNYWTRSIQKSILEFMNREKNGNYVRCLDSKNFAIKISIMKKFMFDSSLGNMEDFDLYLRICKNHKIFFIQDLVVKHFHKSRFKEVIMINFDRAYWVYKIYQKHKNNYDILNNQMFSSISLKSFIFHFPWCLHQFLKRPFGEAYYILVSHTFWRIGLLWGMIKK